MTPTIDCNYDTTCARLAWIRGEGGREGHSTDRYFINSQWRTGWSWVTCHISRNGQHLCALAGHIIAIRAEFIYIRPDVRFVQGRKHGFTRMARARAHDLFFDSRRSDVPVSVSVWMEQRRNEKISTVTSILRNLRRRRKKNYSSCLSSTILSFKEIEKESRPNFRETDARPLLPVDKYRSIFKYLRCYAIFPRIGYSIRDMARFPPTVSMRIYRPKYDFMKINAAFVGRIDK